MAHLGQYHDDTIYWATAKSLADGTGYRIISLPEQPVQTKYPPLYPLFLAAVWKSHSSFPHNVTTALWLQWLFLPAFLWLGRKMLLELGIEARWTWLLTAWMGVSTPIVWLSLTFMSDLPYCALLFGSLILVSRAAHPGAPARPALLAGLLAGLGYLTRTAALPLLVAAPLWLAWRRRYHRAALFVGASAPAVIWWMFWVRSHLQPSSDFTTTYYLDYVGYQLHSLTWGNVFWVVRANAANFLFGISELLTSRGGQTPAAGIFWRMFGFASLAGCWRIARREGMASYVMYGLCSVPLLLVCAWPIDARQLVPLFPLFLAGLWVEVGHVAGGVRLGMAKSGGSARLVSGLIGAVFAVALSSGVYANLQNLFGILPKVLSDHRVLDVYRKEAYAWIAGHVPAEASFVACDDVLLYLHTGRSAWRIELPYGPYFLGQEDAYVAGYTAVREFAQQHGATYLLATDGDYSRGELFLVSRRTQIQKILGETLAPARVYAGRGASVYRLDTGDAVSSNYSGGTGGQKSDGPSMTAR